VGRLTSDDTTRMKPVERVLAAINHREPDRVPIFLGASNATGLKMGAYNRFRELRGLAPVRDLADRANWLYRWPTLGTALPDAAGFEALCSDVRPVLDCEPAHVQERDMARQSRPDEPYIDSWGCNYYTVHPLQHAQTPDDVAAYTGWPDAADATRYDGVREAAQRLHDEGVYAVLGTPWLLFPLERAFALQGMETFLESLAARPEMAAALLRKNLECCEAIMARFLDECGQYLHIVKIGDDLGTQASLLMSPAMYRRVLKPIHRELVQFIRRRCGHAKIFFHTDGDVAPLVDDFIEIGIDVLNPIQTSAGRMSDLAKLKERTRGRLALCGAIDTHRVLPCGTPAEVAAEVRRVMRILAPGGGYLLSSVHTIMDDVPAENIAAMIDTCHSDFGRYPISC
jgi:uroporphyrinogen decarboxylase